MIIVTDANVLINLMHVTRLDICARLPRYEFVIPDHVREEITDANQRMTLDDAVVHSVVRIEAITDLSAVTLFAELIGVDAQRRQSAPVPMASRSCPKQLSFDRILDSIGHLDRRCANAWSAFRLWEVGLGRRVSGTVDSLSVLDSISRN